MLLPMQHISSAFTAFDFESMVLWFISSLTSADISALN
uniref:Uncharacterized protein n=1 Tax=Arundo donax TaxID=35708 RepID=A0A0A9GJY9_ARUDO